MRWAILLAALFTGCGPAAICERFQLQCDLEEGIAWPEEPEDADGDVYSAAVDCDDTNADINPGTAEVCDGVDQDCDGLIDEDFSEPMQVWYLDEDGDGYGDPDIFEMACEARGGWVLEAGDCNDQNSDENPGEPEDCTNRDRDCDGDATAGSPDGALWYRDADDDGYGDPALTQLDCEAQEGWVSNDLDCDDTDDTVHPAAVEFCDELDHDCDGDPQADAVDLASFYGDADGDGYGDAAVSHQACELPPGWVDNDQDCDDGDSGTYPGADECPDTRDNDCDGTVDEGATGTASEWYADLDGDSYGDPLAVLLGCQQPLAYVADGTDCDDGDAAISPAGTEICTAVGDDPEDEDCDGLIDDDDHSLDTTTRSSWYPDSDGDGFGDPDEEQLACTEPADHGSDDSDCDDTDAEVYPGAPERCGNGLIDDCDSTTADAEAVCDLDTDAWSTSAPESWTGSSTADRLGRSLAMGDLDGDGLAEVIVGAYTHGSDDAGAVFLSFGATSGPGEWGATLSGGAVRDYAGQSVAAVGDIDGDGWSDLAVGAHGHDAGGSTSGVAHLVFGPITGDRTLGDDLDWTGESAGDRAGWAMSAAGDHDGDGLAELLVGAPWADGGAVYLVGSSEDTLGAKASLTAEGITDRFGKSVAGGGDIDGDGVDDLVVGAPASSSGAGAAYIFLGPLSGDVDASDAEEIITSSAGDYFGTSVALAGDVDGDGLEDVWGGGHRDDQGASETGSAWLFLGPATGASSTSLADAALYGVSKKDWLGYALAAAGDIDADGHADVLLGALGTDEGGTDAGAAWLVQGPVSGVSRVDHAGTAIFASASNEAFGTTVTGGGDVDGDDIPDLLIAGSDSDEAGTALLWRWLDP